MWEAILVREAFFLNVSFWIHLPHMAVAQSADPLLSVNDGRWNDRS